MRTIPTRRQRFIAQVEALKAQGASSSAIAAHLGRDSDTFAGWLRGTHSIPQATAETLDRVELINGVLVTTTTVPTRGPRVREP